MDETEYLCKDCKHSFVHWATRLVWLGFVPSIYYNCRKAFTPKKTEFDPVFGTKKVSGTYDSCRFARRNTGPCSNAKMWTPKHKKDLFKALKKERNV